jgi:hypothetical protein
MSRAYSVAADPFVADTLLRGVPDEEDEEEDDDEEEQGEDEEEEEENEDQGEGYSVCKRWTMDRYEAFLSRRNRERCLSFISATERTLLPSVASWTSSC